jgi:hypothetical protein
MLDKEVSRGEFSKSLAKLVAVSPFLPAVLSSSEQQADWEPFKYFPHKLEWGVIFSSNEAAWLGLPVKESFTQLMEMGPDWVKLCWLMSKKPEDNLENLRYQYGVAGDKGVKVMQVLGPREPHSPEDYLPEDLSRSDPNYSQKCLEHLERIYGLLDTAGMTAQVEMWQLGNESDDTFPKVSRESPAVLEGLRKLIEPTGKPTMINKFMDMDGPDRYWQILQNQADIAGLDMYTEPGRGTFSTGRLFRTAKNYIKSARIPVVGSELQTMSWIPGEYSIEDLKNNFFAAGQLLRMLMLWDSIRWLKKENSPTLNAIKDLVAFTQSSNAALASSLARV